MSNYLFAMGKKKSIDTLHASLLQYNGGVESELTVEEHSEGIWLLIVEKRVAHIPSSVIKVENSSGGKEKFYFKGWCQDHDSRTMALGKKGFQQSCIEQEGRSLTSSPLDLEGAFVLATWDEERLMIQNDLFSLFPVLFFSTADVVVASDSLFVLTRMRKALGLPCTLNKRVVYSRAWTQGIACACMSNDTIVKGIKLLSPGKFVESSLRRLSKSKIRIGSAPMAKMVHRDVKRLFLDDLQSYPTALVNSISQLCASMTALVQMEDISLRFGLSGGLDSRVLLALLLKNKQCLDRVNITTSTHQSRAGDYEVVAALAARFGFEFNQPNALLERQREGVAQPEMISNSFGLWVLSSMGIFDMIYLYPSYWSHPVVIELGGHGAEAIKGTFASTALTDILHTRPRRRFVSIQKEINAALRAAGVNPSEEAPLQWHHLCFKSAIQNGRFVDRTCMALRPILNRSMYSLARSECNPFRQPVEGEPTLLHDMLIMLDAELAAEPFENPKYNLSQDYIDERLEVLGGSISLEDIKPYTVHGSVFDIANGPVQTFMEMVTGFDFKDRDHREAIRELLEECWAKIVGTGLEKIYSYAYDLARNRLDDPEYYIPSAGTPAAKIISLLLVDEISTA